MNTQTRTAIRATLHAPPAANTWSRRQSHIPVPTTTAPITARRLRHIENDVHKALAVLDKTTGKMLNYHQLLNHPAYHADWTLSSANKFGQLANGIGGRVKGTNTIKFIQMQTYRETATAMSLMVHSYLPFNQKRKKPIEPISSLAEI